MTARPKVTEVINQDGETLAVGDRVRSIPSAMWPASDIPPSTGRITRIGYKYVSVWADSGRPLLFSVSRDGDGTWRTSRLVKLS